MSSGGSEVVVSARLFGGWRLGEAGLRREKLVGKEERGSLNSREEPGGVSHLHCICEGNMITRNLQGSYMGNSVYLCQALCPGHTNGHWPGSLSCSLHMPEYLPAPSVILLFFHRCDAQR